MKHPSFNKEKLAHLPVEPGVYLMKDSAGAVIYVGKAKNIRQRVKNYFTVGGDGRPQIPFLVEKIATIDSIVVNSEKEALLLESNLIKQHQPRYNALLKDDKSYIALKIAMSEEWPTVKIVRTKGNLKSGDLYFGPYTSARAARETLELLNRLFPLRQCSDAEFARRQRPCLLYEMGRCAGPCARKCTKEEYDQHVKRVVQFLRGRDKEVLKDLKSEMQRCSDNLEFERAAALYRTIQYIEKTLEQQYVDRLLGVNADVFGIARHGNDALLVQLLFRGGRLIGSSPFAFSSVVEDDKELLRTFILQHYEMGVELPAELFVPCSLSDRYAIEEVLRERYGKTALIHHPLRGENKALIEMAKKNAEALFKGKLKEEMAREKMLLEMQETLSLSRYPVKIECIDNSHSSGSEMVAAVVAFQDGVKETRRYRCYRVNDACKGDDCAAMTEVLLRRYKKGKEEGVLPDLLIVDGGKGQLNAAKEALQQLNVTGVDLIAIAKEAGRHDKGATGEVIYLQDGRAIQLNKSSPLLFFVQNIRDEAHRFVLAFHRKRRAKNTLKSALDDISGIGPAKKKALLTRFGSLAGILAASDEELLEVTGITQAIVAGIRGVRS